ncbi:oxalyl-CoA decarboxylase [Oxalobacter vibrioformis]|uniref:Oxalyl-CoA decarboxylase n=1 Tax=Oxalobacter vibrioformis TaxID=933080 RepID=A0A9E9M127_9BURK|nr:oxalyl-CoA decarboxylase [Oxalobacter vibrioformis]WAW11212.1 oxalyl-CoA decarboxylase [Oxalobacter vibrioformis]
MSNETEVELVDAFYMLIESLKNNGIENVYGIPGIPVTALIRSWQAEGGKWYGFRHETNAAMAAGVAGYLTGKPGVCLTTPAPGFLNGLAGAANATTNGWPMILLSGAAGRRNTDLQQGAFEEMDQLNAARPHVKAAYRINHISDIPIAVARAVRTAVSGRPGAVYLDLSHEMLTGTMPAAAAEALLFTPVDPTPKQLPDPAAVKRAADLLKGAKKPLILLGKGAAYAQADADIKALVEDTGIPFLPMSMAKGLLPDNHPQCAGPARSYVLPECDVVLIVGARLNWLLGNGKGNTWGNQLKKFIQIDILPQEIDSNVPIAAPLVGDIASCIAALREALKGMPKADAAWMGGIAERVNASKEKLAPTLKVETPPGMMNYRNSLGALRDVLAKYPSVTLVNEGANALDNTRMIVDQYQPRKRIDSGTWGIMGIGMGACIGAAVVTGEPVVAVEGDSAFGFSGMEVETMVRYNLPICVIVMNNGGIYKGNETNAGGYDDPSPTSFAPGSRYDKMIEAFGGVGVNAQTPAELAAAVEEAIKSRKPTLINACLDPDAGVESGRIAGLNIERKKKK